MTVEPKPNDSMKTKGGRYKSRGLLLENEER